MKLFAHQRKVLCCKLESYIVIEVGAWSNHVVVWIAELEIFCEIHLSVRNRSILEYERCLEEKKVKSLSDPTPNIIQILRGDEFLQ